MIGIYLKYSDIFEDYKECTLQSILQNTPSSIIITGISIINSCLYYYNNNRNSLDNQKILFNNLISTESEENRILLNNKLQKFLDRPYNIKSIFLPYHNLQIIEKELLNYRFEENISNPIKDEIIILKAILYYNEFIDIQEHEKFNSSYVVEIVWNLAYRQYEFNTSKNLYTNLYLFVQFITYLNSNYSEYLKSYFKSVFQIDTTLSEYMKKLLLLLKNSLFQQNQTYFNCIFQNEVSQVNELLSFFSIDIYSFDKSDYEKKNKSHPFKVLREKPIIKLENGNYVIINWNFVVDKLYNGFIFDFYNLSGISEVFNSWTNYKSIIGKNFSERILFKGVLETLFHNDKQITLITEFENPDKKIDFYLRIENTIFLIEFKDYLFPDEKKMSGSKSTIENYLDERLIKNEKDENKGIKQLIEQIKNLDTDKNFIIDVNRPDNTHLFIQPIIIYTDNAFSMAGINEYLSNRFIQELGSYQHSFFKVCNLLLISSNYFIDNYYYFETNPKNFRSLIVSYIYNRIINKNRYLQDNNPVNYLKSISSFDVIMKRSISYEDILYNALYKEIKEFISD